MSTSLDVIVNSTEVPESTEVEPEATVETTEATEEVEASTTTETETEEVTEESTPTVDVQKQIDDLTGQVKAFQSKAQDEVRKRQAIEQQVERADAYVEPDKAIEQAVNDAKSEVWSGMRLMQENNQKALHDDYDEKFTAFEQLAKDNPVLLEQARSEFDPCKFIYETATNHEKLETMGDLGTFEERIREDQRKIMQAEFDDEKAKLAEKAIDDAIPNTLSDVTAAGAAGGNVYAGKTPLNKILKR